MLRGTISAVCLFEKLAISSPTVYKLHWAMAIVNSMTAMAFTRAIEDII